MVQIVIDLDNLEDTIERIYEQYYLDVYKFLVSFTGNQSDAEDLTQDVFIRVLKSLPKFNEHYKLKTWVLSIAKHTAIDHFRKKKFYSLFEDNFFKQLLSKEKQPDEIAENLEKRTEINTALTTLKPQYRMVFILRGVNEYSIKETAEIMDWSEAKVKVTYHRALKKLKEELMGKSKGVLENANC
ncbi:RNA polymerase sigma factor [Bacillus alkalicola]|uniref:RNA polymerase sigma factor n=2 Tax=Evansella alkalicola TaxID=745819 RepID=A0ABS6JNV5_9BACI|nr:RNA polymerase sigma factor [Bacillus alkalicola]